MSTSRQDRHHLIRSSRYDISFTTLISGNASLTSHLASPDRSDRAPNTNFGYSRKYSAADALPGFPVWMIVNKLSHATGLFKNERYSGFILLRSTFFTAEGVGQKKGGCHSAVLTIESSTRDARQEVKSSSLLIFESSTSIMEGFKGERERTLSRKQANGFQSRKQANGTSGKDLTCVSRFFNIRKRFRACVDRRRCSVIGRSTRPE